MSKSKSVIIIKKSRFVSYSKRISSENEAKCFVNEITLTHKKARHVAFAYVLDHGDIVKYSDAGEPRGTAGLPILTAIQRRDFSEIVVAVVRYFGGVLLGKGGLIRAYGKAAGHSLTQLAEDEFKI